DLLSLFFLLLPVRRLPSSPLFPYTTLFRSRAMLQLYRRDGGFDWASVLEQVAANGELDNAGGREALHAYLRDMSESVPSGYAARSEEHTSELQSRENLVCRLLLEKKKQKTT